jgi:cytoskeleton protein RodZ
MLFEDMSEHLGHELKALRESQGITLEQAARETCLRAGFLRELEESATAEDLPDVYRKLSLRMYARYLGLEVENTRRAVRTAEGMRLAPVGLFVRRMGRPPAPPSLPPGQRNRLLTVAKTTSALVVVVLAVGLWSLSAQLSRLDIDELADRKARAVTAPEPTPLTPVVVDWPRCELEHPVSFGLTPFAPEEQVVLAP